MGRFDDETTTAARSGVAEVRDEEMPRRVVSGEERDEKKPRASEEIVIEEISIDGMCGVY